MDTLGSLRASGAGSHQAHLPSICMTAGTMRQRMTTASKDGDGQTETELLEHTVEAEDEGAEDEHHDGRGGGDDRG